MKKILALATTAALVLGSIAPASAGWISDTNAKANTPAAKAARLKATCAEAAVVPDKGRDTSMIASLQCEQWAKTGVPDSDVRVMIVATGALLGAVAGGALVATPAIVGQSGAFTAFGVTPTLIQAATAGAVVGGAVGVAGSALAK